MEIAVKLLITFIAGLNSRSGGEIERETLAQVPGKRGIRTKHRKKQIAGETTASEPGQPANQ